MSDLLTAGQLAPNFSLPDQQGEEVALRDFQGSLVLLYFYPKDGTPGCTKEACSFRDNYQVFTDKGVVVLGVSADSTASHAKFQDKHDLPFTLLSDPKREVIAKYGAASGLFTKRISYLIGRDGKILAVYPDVKPESHADQVLVDVAKLG